MGSDGVRKTRGSSARAKSSKSVRLDDKRGFDHKFNKTGFKSPVKRHLWYYYVKCYEKVLRGEGESSVMERKEFLKYRGLSEDNPLKELPAGFQDFTKSKKIETLTRLFEELADAAAAIVGQKEDVGIQGNCPEKMEVDEGSVGDLGPEFCINASPLLHGDSLQHVARNLQDNPEGRPPTSSGQHLDKLHQRVSELKRRASRFPNASLGMEWWERHFMLLIKLEDRELSEALGVDPRSEDIVENDSQIQPLMEGIGSQASYSQASSFGEDLERGVTNNVTSMLHVEHDPAVDPEVDPPTASSLGVLPAQDILEAWGDLPILGRSKEKLEEIWPPVFVHNTAEDLQYQFSKPTMEGVYPEACYPEASSQLGDEQYCGEYSADYGGYSASHTVQMGHAFGRTTPGLSAEEIWNEPEGSPSSLWSYH